MDAMKKNLKNYVCNDPAWIERFKSNVFGCRVHVFQKN